MTEEGIFLGGGDMAGMFKDWTIPNIYGSFGKTSTAHNGGNSTSGVFSFAQQYYNSSGDGALNTGGTVYFDLNNDSIYKNHINTLSKFYPKHYNVDWYIKYK